MNIGLVYRKFVGQLYAMALSLGKKGSFFVFFVIIKLSMK